MKTTMLRKLIIAGSLGICAMSNAAPLGNFEKSPENVRPVMPRITPVPVPPLHPGPVHPVQPIHAHPTVTVCVPVPADEKVRVLPRPFPMPDFTVRNLLSVTGNDSGCVDKPGKPTRPIPRPSGSHPII